MANLGRRPDDLVLGRKARRDGREERAAELLLDVRVRPSRVSVLFATPPFATVTSMDLAGAVAADPLLQPGAAVLSTPAATRLDASKDGTSEI
jgi:hypothetical protein